MAPQRDLPGFYFDPEKNRYFPIKGPLPGSKRARPFSSSSSSSKEGSASGKRHYLHLARKKELMESFKLLQSREIHGGLLISKKGPYSFQQEYQNLLASHPEVWKYNETTFVSDSALEEMHGVVQTSQGLKEAHLLAMGGINCSISLYGIKNVRRRSDYGPNYMPAPVWPSLRDSHNCAPGIFSNSAAFTNLPSSISCIKRIGRNTPNTTDNISCFQHALVTTLGSGVSGGSVYLLNLREPLNFSENSSRLNRRINKVSSCDCTIWTADTSHCSTKAAIGSNFGVSLINLETGRSSLLYRSRSDVLSQQFDISGNILLCGIRNGTILAIDVRQRQPKCFEVSARRASRMQNPHKEQPRRNSNSSNAVFMPSAVCSVVALQSDEQYFFGSSMDGSQFNGQIWRVVFTAVIYYHSSSMARSGEVTGFSKSSTSQIS
ncbi:uncharacterized protein LOC110031434 [Phalaenopsis equestris]|uniref:uncharacterized protein LOC110031434 n=1 Tax=Phalaenopsis equestris TaxID=78828 RepID=UPI0009E25CA1|nr:uncharacterized protein LOC110031434 [Phalaenopsis equestris]